MKQNGILVALLSVIAALVLVAASVLVGLGMRKLSMGRAFVAQTKKMITGMTISRAREIACRVCDMETAAEIQEYLTSELQDIL